MSQKKAPFCETLVFGVLLVCSALIFSVFTGCSKQEKADFMGVPIEGTLWEFADALDKADNSLLVLTAEKLDKEAALIHFVDLRDEESDEFVLWCDIKDEQVVGVRVVEE